MTSDVGGAGAVGLDVAVGLQGAEEVLGVEPAADGHDGRLDVLQVRPQVARLPELVVGAVGHHLVPEGDVALEVLLVGVAERPQAQEEVVAVRRVVLEVRAGPCGSAPAAAGRSWR